MKTIFRLFTILALCSLSFAQTTIFPKTTVFPKTTIFGAAVSANNAAVVQSPASCYANATTCTATLGANVTAGNRLLVYEVSNGAVAAPIMTGETFVNLGTASGCSNNSVDDTECYLVSSAVGGHSAVTCGSSTVSLCIVVEVSHPQNLSTPKDAGGNHQDASGTSFSVSTSATTTVAGDIVIACFGSIGIAGTYTAVAPFALVKADGNGGSQNLMCESNVPGSTGTQTATATNAANGRTTEGIVAIKP